MRIPLVIQRMLLPSRGARTLHEALAVTAPTENICSVGKIDMRFANKFAYNNRRPSPFGGLLINFVRSRFLVTGGVN